MHVPPCAHVQNSPQTWPYKLCLFLFVRLFSLQVRTGLKHSPTVHREGIGPCYHVTYPVFRSATWQLKFSTFVFTICHLQPFNGDMRMRRHTLWGDCKCQALENKPLPYIHRCPATLWVSVGIITTTVIWRDMVSWWVNGSCSKETSSLTPMPNVKAQCNSSI